MKVAPHYSSTLDSLVPAMPATLNHGLEHILTLMDILDVYAVMADSEFLRRHAASVSALYSRVRPLLWLSVSALTFFAVYASSID